MKRKQPSRSGTLLLAMLVIFSDAACVKRSASKEQKEAVTPSPRGALHLVDPDSATVTASATTLAVNDFAGRYKLPGFSLRLSGANYVKVLRCQDDYREYLEYMITQTEKQEASTRHGRKWVWVDSYGNAKFCKLASNNFVASDFQDLGARNGKFFYIINPCVSAELSTTGQDECSNLLTITDSVDYKDSPSQEFNAKTAEFTEAEAAYDAIYAQLLGLSRSIMNEKEACAAAITQIESQRNVDSAGWDLLAAAVTVGLGLGVRALASPRVMHAIADKMGAYNSAGAKFVKTFTTSIGDASPSSKNFIVAGFTGGALAIALAIKNAKSTRGSGGDHPSCAKAEALAGQVVAIQEQKLLEHAQKKIIALSQELRAIEATFAGYSDANFTIPTAAAATKP